MGGPATKAVDLLGRGGVVVAHEPFAGAAWALAEEQAGCLLLLLGSLQEEPFGRFTRLPHDLGTSTGTVIKLNYGPSVLAQSSAERFTQILALEERLKREMGQSGMLILCPGAFMFISFSLLFHLK